MGTLSATLMSPRRLLADLHAAAVAAVQGERIIPRYGRVEQDQWVFRRAGRELRCALPDRSRGGRLRLIGLGKAALGMARGFRDSLRGSGYAIDDGLLIVRDLPPASAGAEPWRVLPGDHPLPGGRSEHAARQLLEFIGTPSAADRFVVLLSGGASALCALPAPGVTLDDKRRITAEMLRSGAPIAEINRVRRRLSAIKGGKLAARLTPAEFVTLAISDVAGDDPAVIGSAPTWRDEQPAAAQPPYIVIAGLDDALATIAEVATASGFAPVVLGRTLYADVAVEAQRIVAALSSLPPADGRPQLLLAGGEPLVTVCGAGCGGRAQELALRLGELVARRTSQWPQLAAAVGLVAGTDGADGPTAAAGAFFDGSTAARAAAVGLDLATRLADNDSHTALAALGDLYLTGPTGTNVADVLMVLMPDG